MVHGVLTLTFLGSLQWTAFLLNLPLACYHGYRYGTNKYIYDATDIFRMLPRHKTECLIKLAFYLISFFFYLYR